MSEVKKTFLVPLDIKQSSNDEIFTIVEGDNGNVLVVTLTDDGEPVHLTDCLVVAVFAKPNGTTVEQDSDGHGITVDAENDNVFTIDLYTTSFMQGNISCEIQVLSGEEYEVLVTSAKFNFTCRRSIMNTDTIQATDEYPILVGLINEVTELDEGVTLAEANRQSNEGTRQENEATRVSREAGRVSAETARSTAEGLRATAETDRAKAEAARATLMEAWEDAEADAETLPAGSEATVDVTVGETVSFNFGIPVGESGIHRGPLPPTDPNKKIWIKTTGGFSISPDMSQTEYDALDPPDSDVVYFVYPDGE